MLTPVADDDGAPFWEYAAQGELRVQACAAPDCGRLRFPPRPCCPHCQSFDSEWRRVSGRGRIWSYVFPHPPLLPDYAAQAPYNAVIVELAEDPLIRLVGNVVAEPDARARLGRPGAAEDRGAGAGRVHRGRRDDRAALAPGARMSVLVERDKETGVAVVTLNRPERLNAVDLETADQLPALWRELRFDDTVRAVVLTGAGERAFCTGIDRSAEVPQPSSPYSTDDPLIAIGPKANDLWKPVIAAVRGMACGGAFYLLGEAEFVIAAEDATFFDPHTTYGMVSAYESMYLALRMPHGEAARLALMGTAERMSARPGVRDRVRERTGRARWGVGCGGAVRGDDRGVPDGGGAGDGAVAVGRAGGRPCPGPRTRPALRGARQPAAGTAGGAVRRAALRGLPGAVSSAGAVRGVGGYSAAGRGGAERAVPRGSDITVHPGEFTNSPRGPHEHHYAPAPTP